MGENDWMRIHGVAIRAQFVQALVRAANHHGTLTVPPDADCTDPICCLDLSVMAARLGLALYNQNIDQWTNRAAMNFDGDAWEWVEGQMSDAMLTLSELYGSKYLEGGGGFPQGAELPPVVDEIYQSDYFKTMMDKAQFDLHVRKQVRIEFVTALVEVAFTDDYIFSVEATLSTSNATSILRGRDAAADLSRRFIDAGFVFPVLTQGIIDDLRVDTRTFATATSHFEWGEESADTSGDGGRWSLIAGYHLNLDLDASLARYWNDFPSVPEAFVYSEHGNMAGTGMGFLARSHGLLVSQQVWDRGENSRWNTCTDAFNEWLYQIMEDCGPDGAAMVVFSDFRDDAYIVSCVPRSWDEYAPASAVLGPLPDGWGIVGVWNNYDEGRYTPRPLEYIIRADWSDQITASARYLSDCLTILAGK